MLADSAATNVLVVILLLDGSGHWDGILAYATAQHNGRTPDFGPSAHPSKRKACCIQVSGGSGLIQ